MDGIHNRTRERSDRCRDSASHRGRIVSIDGETAELAAELFNAIGRKRALRYDCVIAASSTIGGQS